MTGPRRFQVHYGRADDGAGYTVRDGGITGPVVFKTDSRSDAEAKATEMNAPLLAHEAIAASIVGEVMAQLEEPSDETMALILQRAGGDDALLSELLALATDLRETLMAAVDQRVSDWTVDNAPAT